MKVQINTQYSYYYIIGFLMLVLALMLVHTNASANANTNSEKFKATATPLCHTVLNDPNSPHKISNVYPSLQEYLKFEQEESKQPELQKYVHSLKRPEINNLTSEERYRKNDYGTSILSNLQYSSNA